MTNKAFSHCQKDDVGYVKYFTLQIFFRWIKLYTFTSGETYGTIIVCDMFRHQFFWECAQ